jgi:uncharacterized membrane protein YheB (UPF0754 family)
MYRGFINLMIYNNPYVLLPLSGAAIGFFTNYLAIRFLFSPKKRFMGIQGLIPRRKDKIAEKIAEASLSFLPEKIDTLVKIPIIGDGIVGYIKKEVSKKVRKMDDYEIERIVRSVAKKELRFIEFSGAVVGFLIGMVQAFLISL